MINLFDTKKKILTNDKTFAIEIGEKGILKYVTLFNEIAF